MSPLAYTLNFSASMASEQVDEALRLLAELGDVSMGTKDRQHFVVIGYLPELNRFERLTSDWQKAGVAHVRPLGP